jgi:hypothetical protein
VRLSSLLVVIASLYPDIASCSSNDDVPLRADSGEDDAGVDAASAQDSSVVDAASHDAAIDHAADTGIGGCSASADSGHFPAFADACSSLSDCVMVLHQLDCCGSLAAIGINVAVRNDFDVAEQTWQASCPACGCAQQPTNAQDGNVASSIASIHVACAKPDAGADAGSGSGVCRTYVQ